MTPEQSIHLAFWLGIITSISVILIIIIFACIVGRWIKQSDSLMKKLNNQNRLTIPCQYNEQCIDFINGSCNGNKGGCDEKSVV
jgi:sensor histidine kinase YesM